MEIVEIRFAEFLPNALKIELLILKTIGKWRRFANKATSIMSRADISISWIGSGFFGGSWVLPSMRLRIKFREEAVLKLEVLKLVYRRRHFKNVLFTETKENLQVFPEFSYQT